MNEDNEDDTTNPLYEADKERYNQPERPQPPGTETNLVYDFTYAYFYESRIVREPLQSSKLPERGQYYPSTLFLISVCAAGVTKTFLG